MASRKRKSALSAYAAENIALLTGLGVFGTLSSYFLQIFTVATPGVMKGGAAVVSLTSLSIALLIAGDLLVHAPEQTALRHRSNSNILRALRMCLTFFAAGLVIFASAIFPILGGTLLLALCLYAAHNLARQSRTSRFLRRHQTIVRTLTYGAAIVIAALLMYILYQAFWVVPGR